ncbi:YhcN/YlaJ family sporulation lipoprotein [Paraliobacillus salinarum]|uniref:YhcN/YlaJ family sporulation lipoprotein n=1 Tax=Paraliobacillus salinarum TaxID=1158996 RepID=UPI0015F65CA9|nr:YhcN/YlaJ family sporulation lipoprotein [Paraliobacillus salinarum]
MRWKRAAAYTTMLLALTACGTGDDNAIGQRDTNNIEPVRNEGTLEAPMRQNYGQPDNYGNNNYGGTYQRGRDLTTNNVNNKAARNTNNSYQMSEAAAKRMTKEIKQIDQAYVLKMGNNAYVAAKLDKDNDKNTKATKEVKQQIAKIVKLEEYDVDYVYVSTNPDFVDLTTDYANQVKNGEPIEGFFDQMGEMIQRVFPRAQQ